MKRTFTLMTLCLLMLLVGCGSPHNESSAATTEQYTANEDKESSSTRGSIDELLKESYPWRKAYAEFLWDRDLFNAELKSQFTNLAEANYEYYTPELGLLFLDSDEIPELLVYYKNEAPPAPEYYVIYHYVPATKEYSSSIALYHSGYSGNGSITWKYLPHGNAYYTGYYKCMGGFYDYDLLFLENGKWVKWDDVPVITSRIIAENYGVFDGESINIHDVEPMFSNDWRTPELKDEWMSLYHGEIRHATIEAMFGSDAVVGLLCDTE